MRKTIRLTENELISLVKKIIKESTTGFELVVTGVEGVTIPFNEGGYGNEFTPQQRTDWVNKLSAAISNNLLLIGHLSDNRNMGMELPAFIKYDIGTSSTGTEEQNSIVAKKRQNYILKMIEEALKKASTVVEERLDPEYIRKYTINATGNYYQTGMSSAFDKKTSTPNPQERKAYIEVHEYELKGLDLGNISKMRRGMESGRGDYFWGFGDYDPKQILDNLRKLQTYSDIQDIDTDLGNYGGLERFLNKELETGADVDYWKGKAAEAINNASRTSGKGDIARIYKGDILLNLVRIN